MAATITLLNYLMGKLNKKRLIRTAFPSSVPSAHHRNSRKAGKGFGDTRYNKHLGYIGNGHKKAWHLGRNEGYGELMWNYWSGSVFSSGAKQDV
jgi:hypothetical protein